MESGDAELVESSRRGDVEAFSRLVERHRRDALRLAYTIAGDDAEDVVQEACVKAYRHLDGFRDGATFRTWLYAIVANEARNGRRGAGRRSALTLRAAARRVGEPDGPEDAAVAHEQRQRLLDAVATLGERDREVVALRFFLGLSEAEAAEVLGCPQGTVKSRLSRALNRLRTELSEEVVA
jgi:RNA polymerase sigma-70 factor (ECF subfamily)